MFNRKTYKGRRAQRVRQASNKFYVNGPEDEAACYLDLLGFSFSKRGYPDLTVYNGDGTIYGFVEIKPEEDRPLKREQEVFKIFCEKHRIPFLKWCPSDGVSAIELFLGQ